MVDAVKQTDVQQTMIVRFMRDGSVQVKLSGVDGITARKLEAVSVKAFNEMNRMRAVERHKSTSELERKRVEEASKLAKEAETAK